MDMQNITIYDRALYYYDDGSPIANYLKYNKQLYGEVQYNFVKQFLFPYTDDDYIIDYGAGIGTFSFVPAIQKQNLIAIENRTKNLECLRKTFDQFNNVSIETSTNIDQVCDRSNNQKIKLIKISEETNPKLFSESQKRISEDKPLLLVGMNAEILNNYGYHPKQLLSSIYHIGYIPMLYNGNNFLISIDPKQKFPFCIMDLICIHKDNIHKYVGNITIGSYLSDDLINSIIVDNLKQEYIGDYCKCYLENL